MTQHYPRTTVETAAWCKKCHKQTMHRVDGVKLGACKVCLAKLNEPKKPAPISAPVPVQMSFSDVVEDIEIK